MLGRLILSVIVLSQCPGGTCPEPAIGRERQMVVAEAVAGDVIVRRLDGREIVILSAGTCEDGTCGQVQQPEAARDVSVLVARAESGQRLATRQRVVRRRLFGWLRCR